ncbi:uncharacterized protein L3040_008687 [Drepanopeziza brunnea f. sp. 'multigermtubi']|uniref:uncharacterized protein n=1 Tax=Drepanopeziza brunnea f. sp. 'multigermtubi' TaxID=698441 RepID=UPI0023A091BC|nr:hypothetical protein L3040_008687 [Drepanopeziza brunnea f. sp. 'multigermtubi']
MSARGPRFNPGMRPMYRNVLPLLSLIALSVATGYLKRCISDLLAVGYVDERAIDRRYSVTGTWNNLCQTPAQD